MSVSLHIYETKVLDDMIFITCDEEWKSCELGCLHQCAVSAVSSSQAPRFYAPCWVTHTHTHAHTVHVRAKEKHMVLSKLLQGRKTPKSRSWNSHVEGLHTHGRSSPPPLPPGRTEGWCAGGRSAWTRSEPGWRLRDGNTHTHHLLLSWQSKTVCSSSKDHLWRSVHLLNCFTAQRLSRISLLLTYQFSKNLKVKEHQESKAET